MAKWPAALRGKTPLAAVLLHLLSWLFLATIVAYGLSLTWNLNADGAYVTTGGLYSGTDGMWAEWNASSIMRFGQFLDPSPFNAFAGMGSMYLPNLPWLNPGALMLAAPFERHTVFVLSYLVYVIEVGAALTVLARSIGFSWAIATIAAELHILVLFPPFSAYFGPLEWYSAAPVYAHLTSVWCLALAAFMACGRKSNAVNTLAAAGLICLVLAGVLSAPFSFIFFVIPFATLGLALLCARPPSPRELLWKAGALAGLMSAAHLAGFTDYLIGTVATSARTPVGATDWSLLLSPSAWFERIRDHSVCGTDARGLMCANNPLWWLQALALAGSLYLALGARGARRAAGVWGILFLGGMHLYAHAYQSGALGPIGTLSTHFLSWSAHAVFPILAVAGVLLAARAMVRALWDARTSAVTLAALFVLGALAFWGPWRAVRNSGLIWLAEPRASDIIDIATALSLWGGFALVLLVAARRVDRVVARFAGSLTDKPRPAAVLLGTMLALAVIPVAAGIVVTRVTAQPGLPDDGPMGPITRTIAEEASLNLDEPFRGYTATYWSPALDTVDQSGMAARSPVFRYIHARLYFVARYGTTFTETDLWRAGIPTFEEYGQWVSRQSQLLAWGLLADPGMPHDYPTFLRLYRLDVDVMRALGIRFLITDLRIDDPRLTFRATESVPGAFPVHLYEIAAPNLGTYSPTQPIAEKLHAPAILARMAASAKDLDGIAVVQQALQGPFAPARRSSMVLKRDGYRVRAEADGRSLLLLPIQFSHCLALADHAGGAFRPRLYRANLAQTLVLFEERLDATIAFDFGFFGNGSCRLRDGRDVAAMTGTP